MGSSVGAVIPSFNRAQSTWAAVRSALASTRPLERIVVVDDASEPRLAVPADLAGERSLTLIRLEQNSGPSAARARAVATLDTDYVAFLDSDDLWVPEKLAAQMAVLAELAFDPLAAVVCPWTVTGEGGVVLETRRPRASASLSDFASGCWYAPGTTMVMARRAILDAGNFDPRLRRLEDLDLMLRFAQAGGRLVVAPLTGASIARGRNARRATVDQAAALLRLKFGRDGPSALPPAVYRRLDAWLAIEEVVAARNDGAWPRAFARLGHSFLMAPRLSIQLERWWS